MNKESGTFWISDSRFGARNGCIVKHLPNPFVCPKRQKKQNDMINKTKKNGWGTETTGMRAA